jgi:hypothetical protein
MLIITVFLIQSLLSFVQEAVKLKCWVTYILEAAIVHRKERNTLIALHQELKLVSFGCIKV